MQDFPIKNKEILIKNIGKALNKKIPILMVYKT